MKVSYVKKAEGITIILVLIFVLVSCHKDKLNPMQILINTDVETGSLQPNSWIAVGATGTTYKAEWTKEEASSQSHSLKISAANSDSINFAYWYQRYSGEMPFNKDLILSVKIKAKNLSGAGVSVAMRADSSTPSAKAGTTFVTTQGHTPISGTFDWTTYNIKMSALRTDAQYLYVFLVYLPNTTGTVYFDDVTLVHN